MVENLRSKLLYKIELRLLKIIPMILAFTALLNSIHICLFKQWFDASEIDCKIVQSAIHYWFNDDDWAYKDKV